MTIFLGDVHGKYSQYKTIIKKYPNTIQVGDMGIGFVRWPHGEFEANPPYDAMVAANALFIRGNHDNPFVCKKHTQWIPDGTVKDDIMFVGGAWSIDWQWRTEGYSWWPEEELSYSEFYKIMDIYEQNKPRIMVTHDCPETVLPRILSHHTQFTTRTGQCLDAMFKLYQPKLHIFGHHHKWFDEVIEGTRFICIPELQWIDVDPETLKVIKSSDVLHSL